MKRQDFRFFHRLRVRWAEVDMQKIVFNAHYLMYFDVVITEYWRALALPYEDAMHQLGGELYVKKASVEFNASARMDDTLDIGMACTRLGNSSMTITGAIFRGEEHLITGELIYVFADPATQTSRPIPPGLRALVQGFEAGEAVLAVRTGPWAELAEPAGQVRTAVFVEEQGIPREEEWDAADEVALHAVAHNRLGQAVATGRLLPATDGVGKIGRMAVHRVLRGTGVGRHILLALMDAARARGDHSVRLSAQRTAESFYRRLGYQPVGEPYDEVGIPHRLMEIRL
ncbi:YbgC/FadM family acyl-CoA thioesterase [Aquabacterium sp. A08]|uniref:YbgC/FadM family acyl-CoA thioesterase n=1 Tax=Aquabacterium sp. A08 TaxID=2718532 RepID=UPI0014247154|nr:YbgC/FadM family acyl-CoA thioesterase [Aquabacterium sp. A08]NIC40759.1 YbgC/FadM family acyl-CoA thioesterase [Aquabacterium sp. A08]NIC42195.1 YbgC/FadM family acyl-CoA thioesterase [Aquabacterium sp. A08]NIC43604.1 YbgC/FadM family acyl-CoA thioesterase [Aquabacterium sp. A08]